MLTDELLKSTAADKIPSDLEGMESTLERLLALIDDTYKYVDDVVVRTEIHFHSLLSINLCRVTFVCVFSNVATYFQENRVAHDNKIGRYLAEAVSSLPKLSPSAFDKLVNDSLQVIRFFYLVCCYFGGVDLTDMVCFV